MKNTISSCLLVVVIEGVVIMGLMAVICRIPVLKRYVLGEDVK